jgi:hypothetical protein
MQKIVDMNIGQLRNFVGRGAVCTDAPDGVLTPPPPDTEPLHITERLNQAAAFCGNCKVRPACCELGARLTDAEKKGSVYGGVYNGSREKFDVLKGKDVSRPKSRKTNG